MIEINPYANMTEQEFQDHENYIWDLNLQIQAYEHLIGRAFEYFDITHDMIAEALHEEAMKDRDPLDSLRVIYCSWQSGKYSPEQADSAAIEFHKIMTKIGKLK